MSAPVHPSVKKNINRKGRLITEIRDTLKKKHMHSQGSFENTCDYFNQFIALHGLYIFLYSSLLFCITLFPYLLGLVSYIYLASVILLGGKFIYDSYDLYITKNIRKALLLFKFSITYLAMLFAALLADHYILML